jgi:cell division protein FtsW
MIRWKTPTILIGIVLILLALGIVMLASASSVKGATYFFDAEYFLKRQLIWMVAGLFAGFLASMIDYHWWHRLAVPAGILALILLAAVLIPHVGTLIGGSRRWLRLGPFSVQPSEFAKIASVVALSAWMAQLGVRSVCFKEGFLLPLAGLSLCLVLILMEPDLGTTVLIAVVGMALMFVGGARPLYLGTFCIVGLVLFSSALWVLRDNPKVKNRLDRIEAFMDPSKHPAAAYQLEQSKEAFTMGGLFGVGLGRSLQKYNYLPEAHTDFILAIVGEELGLLASGGVVALFLGFLVSGMIIASRAPDIFGRLAGFGLTLMTVLQAAINVGVVTGCLPTKGLPLPFISYGGSSLLISLISVGVLVNIARQTHALESERRNRAIQDAVHEF